MLHMTEHTNDYNHRITLTHKTQHAAIVRRLNGGWETNNATYD